MVRKFFKGKIFDKQHNMKKFKEQILTWCVCVAAVWADYAPLEQAADDIEAHEAGLRAGSRRLSGALEALPYKYNVSIPEDGETQLYATALARQIDQRSANLSRQSDQYSATVKESIGNLSQNCVKAAGEVFDGIN